MINSFILNNVLPVSEEVLNNNIYLMLLHARQAPPHIYLSISGKIFSLGVKGAIIDGHMSQMIRFIKSRRIESLFIQLNMPPLFTPADLSDRIREITLAYPKVDAGIATCLTPVRDFCDEVYGTGIQNIHLIFDLLPELQRRGAVGGVYHYFLDDDIRNGSFSMKRYVVADIYESIHKANGLITV
ncbi:MAG: hypothetical protein KDD36_06645 [Flavobacteriales bacterium]|nr:hypothetical protein [Flavobacteriales bacterium]